MYEAILKEIIVHMIASTESIHQLCCYKISAWLVKKCGALRNIYIPD